MHDVLRPVELMLLCLAGVLTEREHLINLYSREENRILREQLGKRPRLTDGQRRRLAVLGKRLGRKLLGEWASLVTPDTIMRWYRWLIAVKHDFSDRRGPGRSPVINLLRKLVVRMALENPLWGYDRIEGEIKEPGHRLSPTTVRNILKANGWHHNVCTCRDFKSRTVSVEFGGPLQPGETHRGFIPLELVWRQVSWRRPHSAAPHDLAAKVELEE